MTAAAAIPSGSPWAIRPTRSPSTVCSASRRASVPKCPVCRAPHMAFYRSASTGASLAATGCGRSATPIQGSLKHSIITAAEADAVASSIIATLGLGEPSGAPLPALHGILVDAPERRWWDANREHLHDEQMASGCLWWPPEEALGAHLARWAHTHDHAVHAEIHWHPNGLPVIVPAPAEQPNDREAYSRRSSTDKRPAA